MMDCFDTTFLHTFLHHVASTLRDVVIISSTLPLLEIHDKIRLYRDQPLLIHGPETYRLPVDDAPRFWLTCGPVASVDSDERHAMLRYLHTLSKKDMRDIYETCTLEEADDALQEISEHTERRDGSLESGHVMVTYTQLVSIVTRSYDSHRRTLV